MLQFFKTDLQWSERFADVWLWMDWPHRAGRHHNRIDLVAVDQRRSHPVQVLRPGRTLAKADINSFLGASGKHPFG